MRLKADELWLGGRRNRLDYTRECFNKRPPNAWIIEPDGAVLHEIRYGHTQSQLCRFCRIKFAKLAQKNEQD